MKLGLKPRRNKNEEQDEWKGGPGIGVGRNGSNHGRESGGQVPETSEEGPGPVPFVDPLGRFFNGAVAIYGRALLAIMGHGHKVVSSRRLPVLHRPSIFEGGSARKSEPPTLSSYFGVSHVEEDGVVRTDQTKLVIYRVAGVATSLSHINTLAGSLNALAFPIQILVRQHSPKLALFRKHLAAERPGGLPERLGKVVDSLDGMLEELGERPGIVDRRFYVVAADKNAPELAGLLNRAGLDNYRLTGQRLRIFVTAAMLGGSPEQAGEDLEEEVVVRKGEVQMGSRRTRSMQLVQWPRAIASNFLPVLMSTGDEMDISIHVTPIPTADASRTLGLQMVRFQAANEMAAKQGKTASPDAEIALQDVLRVRSELHRGVERLFDTSLSITVHANSSRELAGTCERVKAHFAAKLARLDSLSHRQREGMASTTPMMSNPLGEWLTVDTSTLAILFPFGPPDLDHRRGTLYGIDLEGSSAVIFDPFDGTHKNSNFVICATSGAGKSFAAMLQMERNYGRGISGYVIDPEGEYSALARAAGGRVLVPGVPGAGMNPFAIDRSDPTELLVRIGSLRRLIQVMVGETFSAEQRAALDVALANYYEQDDVEPAFQGFYRYLKEGGYTYLHDVLAPFATGSLRHLLYDAPADLLNDEAPITVFDLNHLEADLRPAAAMVCAETVWAAATKSPRPRELKVDEAWSIMESTQGASYMLNLAKRARKHKLSLTSITQDIQDYLSEDKTRSIAGHTGLAVFQNASFKLLLQQDIAAIGVLREACGLTDAECSWLTSCPRGEGLLATQHGNFRIRLEATPEEASLINYSLSRPQLAEPVA